MKHNERPQQAPREPAIITTSARRAWSVAKIQENGVDLVELRQLTRHGDGRLSATSHRSCFRPDVLPHLISVLAQIVAEGRR